MEDGGPSGSAEIGATDSWTPLFEPEISELLCSFAFSHLGQHVVSRHSTVTKCIISQQDCTKTTGAISTKNVDGRWNLDLEYTPFLIFDF